MKNPSDALESEASESKAAPEPFNLFAGLPEEKLSSAQSTSPAQATKNPLEKISETSVPAKKNYSIVWISAFALLVLIALAMIL